MQVYNDEPEFTDIHMIQQVVGLFRNQRMQSIITCGLLGVEYDPDLDVDDYYSLTNHQHSFNGHFDSDRLSENHSYSSVRGNSSPPSYKFQPKESDSERKARLLQEAKKSKEKAEKKRLKKQKRKQRKEMEKAKQNPVKTEEEKDGDQSDEGKLSNDQKKDSAAAKDTDSDCSSSQESSDDEDSKNDSGDFEELDMTSTFVTKAALIAQRKLEQKPKSDKKKTPEKEKSKSVPVKASEDKEVMKGAQQKDSTVSSGSTLENNIKISTELAIIGNKFASTGDYSMAVKYFTNAIKYNPKEFKLFGNRSFCFEKLQEYEKALVDAELSLSVSPGWVKGLFRKGRALAGLKRYEEAADAFRDVLKRDSSYAEAAQELMRVQIIQLMAYGFTREESSNALIIHGTVEKALEVLSKLHPPGAVLNGPLPPPQVANVSGISPVLSANASPASLASAQSYEASKKPLLSKPVVQNIPNVDNQSKPAYNQAVNLRNNREPLELFPVWVGNLFHPVTEAMISKLFSRAGQIFSMKFLPFKRCAFVNFTKQEHCDEAIRRYHGYDLHGVKIVVRYPDRIAPGIGISRSALTACDLQDENFRHYSDGK